MPRNPVASAGGWARAGRRLFTLFSVVALLSQGACNPFCWEDAHGHQRCGFEKMGSVG